MRFRIGDRVYWRGHALVFDVTAEIVEDASKVRITWDDSGGTPRGCWVSACELSLAEHRVQSGALAPWGGAVLP